MPSGISFDCECNQYFSQGVILDAVLRERRTVEFRDSATDALSHNCSRGILSRFMRALIQVTNELPFPISEVCCFQYLLLKLQSVVMWKELRRIQYCTIIEFQQEKLPRVDWCWTKRNSDRGNVVIALAKRLQTVLRGAKRKLTQIVRGRIQGHSQNPQ